MAEVTLHYGPLTLSELIFLCSARVVVEQVLTSPLSEGTLHTELKISVDA